VKKISTLILLLSVYSGNIFSQGLPHWLTKEERLQLPDYLLRNDGIRGTDPPAFVPRASAEWEEIQGLTITWEDFIPILKQIVDYAQEECVVYIVCSDSNNVKNSLTSDNIPLTNVKFLDEDFNSIWCRDYGPWNIYKNDMEELSLVDWIYNRPRPDDDVIPGALADLLGLPIYETTEAPYDLVATGGNFMVDGHGTAFSSKLILEDNGPGNDFDATIKTEAEIDTILKKYMGINRYILMETLPYDEIHHIDMHMKLLDEETLMVGEFPEGVGDGPQIEENLQYVMDNYLNCFGRPYKVVRIPMVPSDNGNYTPSAYYRTYTNSVIVNKTVIVPTYREEFDTTALRIYKESMPGYNIVPIDCDDPSALIIAALGAVHCITKEIASDEPIWISHAPLQNTFDAVSPYLIESKIKTSSGVSSATTYWTVDTSAGFNAEPMTAIANDSFYAYIPAQAAGTQIFYYINAESVSGRNVSKPLTAPEGFWSFMVETATAAIDAEQTQAVLYDPYPNPSNGVVDIGLSLATTMNCKIIVRDVMGRLVQVISEGELSTGIHKFIFKPSNTTAGIYIVEVQTGDEILSKNFIIQK
jgi:agmatine/peptidylarginine deiminase